MSREIKFRSWDNRDKKYHYSDEYRTGLEGFFCHHEGKPIEQYTGLHDKNGKEIFEGDILSMESVGGERFLIGRIAYDDAKAAFLLHYRHEGTDWAGGFGGMFPMSNYVIKGNIHENPELLQDATGKSNQEGNQQWTTSPNSSTPTPTADPTSRAS